MSSDRKLTSREAYNRLFWDVRINRDAFVILYADRTAQSGVGETPLVQWDPEGSIPWHRVLEIRCGGEVVWSREGEDRLAFEDLPALGRLTQSNDSMVGGNRLRSRQVYRHQGTSWEPAEDAPSQKITSFRLVSWNVLYDFKDPTLPSVESRLPLLLAELEGIEWDILMIQEATPDFVRAVLNAPRQTPIYLSESPSLQGIEPHGVLILSRFPFSLVEQATGKRPVLIGTWEFSGRSIHLANLHLPSNRATSASEDRRRHLEELFADLEMLTGEVLIAGDFNLVGEEHCEVIAEANYEDVWSLLNPGEAGITFDPLSNSIARESSRTGLPMRFDRILWRGSDSHLIPRSITRFALSPLEDQQFPSDHFGLCSDWSSHPEPVYRSAVAILPPVDLWPPIQAIREKHDKKIDRWMPHINLLYGFLPEEHFDAVARRAQRALAAIEPLDVTLADVGTFTHSRSTTGWLRPVSDPPDAIHQLQSILEQLFPMCREQSQRGKDGFTPHLSVGQFRSAKAVHQAIPNWQPLSWRVDSIVLISRGKSTPFQVQIRIPLGGGSLAKTVTHSPGDEALTHWLDAFHPSPDEQQQTECQQVVQDLAERVKRIAGESGSLEVIGSWRMGVPTPASDLDLVALLPAPVEHESFIESMVTSLESDAEDLLVTRNARVPRLSFRIRDFKVDLLTATVEDEESWQIVRAISETDHVLEFAQQAMPLETFHRLLRSVRAWAHARGIHGNAWGFLGGFPWAVLTAWSSLQLLAGQRPNRESSVLELLTHFFQVISQHPWPSPVSLIPNRYQAQGPRNRLPILRPVEPLENCAYNITRSTEEILRAEWARGASIFEQEKSTEHALCRLFEPAGVCHGSEEVLRISLHGSEENLNDFCGQFEGRVVGLLIDFERELHLRARPWPSMIKSEKAWQILIGLPLLRKCDREAAQLTISNLLSELNSTGVSWSLQWE